MTRRRWIPVGAAGAMALAAAVWLAAAPLTSPAAPMSGARVLGNPTAAVEVEEWGDFQ